jgi:hypothetical protein
VLAKLEELDPWLAHLGIDPKSNDRIHKAIGALQTAEEGWKAFRETHEVTKIGNIDDYHFGITEALEFSDIYVAFRNEAPEVLGPKLQRALKGPFRPRDETQRNAEGRNTMYELSLAADLKRQGIEVVVGDPDITVSLAGTNFLIECKRPSAEHSIRANVRGAAGQLGGKLDRKDHEEAHGIIAISLSRILNPGTKIFVAPSEADKEKLGDRLAILMQQHENDWKKSETHKRRAAVLFQAVTPAAIGNAEDQRDSLVRLSYMTVMPTGTDEKGFLAIEKTLPQILNY